MRYLSTREYFSIELENHSNYTKSSFLCSKNEIDQNDKSIQADNNANDLNPKPQQTVSRKSQSNELKILKRSCFSLIDIYSTNQCKVLYKNCLLCNRRKDFQLSFANRKKTFQPRRGEAFKPEIFNRKRCIVGRQSHLIGFASSEYTIYKAETAITEHILEHTFSMHESNNNHGNVISKFIDSFIMYQEKERDLNKADKTLLDTSCKIASVTLGVLLSLYVIYLLYKKIVSGLAIK